MVPADDATELRGPCPAAVIAIVDAVAMRRHMSRTALVPEILEAWARDQLHTAQAIRNASAGAMETYWKRTGG